MNFRYIDKNAFYSATGVELTSPQGCKFCAIAARNLLTMISELREGGSTEHKAFIHKLKGISSSCGLIDAARLCQKLEEYNEIINSRVVRNTLNELIPIMLISLDNGS